MFNTFEKALFCNVDQLLMLRRDLAHTYGEGAGRLPAIQNESAVHGENVSLLQDGRFRGDAMHHLIIDGGTDRGRIALIVQKGRDRFVLADELFGINIQFSRAHAGLDGFTKAAEHLVEKRAGLAHAIQLLCILEINHRIASSVSKISALISSRLPLPVMLRRMPSPA